MKRSVVLALMLSIPVGLALAPAGATAATCASSDFGAVVDQTAQALRTLNVDGAQRFQAKLSTLRHKHSLSQDEIETRSASLQDEKIEEFNSEIDSLVSQMDTLSQTPSSQVTCDKLDDLKRVRDRLLTVMGQKSGYMLARADLLFDKPGSAPRTPKPANAPAPVAAAQPNTPAPAVKPVPAAEAPKPAPAKPATPAEAKTAAAQPVPALPERRPTGVRTANNWTPENRPTDRSGGAAGQPQNLQPSDTFHPGDASTLPPPAAGDATFNMNEIRDAGRGIFGTISAEFAGAINYAFHQFGQPNAYITGTEGGGAFLAGLRYGAGTLHNKTAPDSPIFWQGPSAGLDLGAEGSNTLFLVYNLADTTAIYGRFSGIGGSAYVAGGVGINVLGKGKVIIVPIRSGLGLRLGANLAYLKFTERKTWNPF